jgi:hypothetical protein
MHTLADALFPNWRKATPVPCDCGHSVDAPLYKDEAHVCSCGAVTCMSCYDGSGNRCFGKQCDRNADREER